MGKLEPQKGVYRLYNDQTGHSFIGYSHNLDGTRKRLHFELGLNACPYAALQIHHNTLGPLTFEVLEEYRPSPALSLLEIDAHLIAMALKQKEVYHGQMIQL